MTMCQSLYLPGLSLLLCVVMLSSPAYSTQCPSECRHCINQVANCSKRALLSPPSHYPADTKELDLSGNHIRLLGMRSFISRLESLEVLRIPDNNIVSIKNDAFRNFPNLQTLDLTGNRIYRIYRRSLRHITRLQTLTLNRNRIRQMHKIFDFVPNLFQLNLAHNKIRAIGQSDLAQLTQLNYIDFQDNKIVRIHPHAFKNLHGLRYLFLKNNPLTSLPAMTWGSQVLQMLDISHCQLTTVPQPLPASLGDFRLGHNKITQIQHTDFINITELQMLALNDNQLQFLADGTFSHLLKLIEIWLRGNKLVYIPRDLPDNLRRLHMDGNLLQQIEVDVFSPNSHLEYLTVEGNQLTRMAEGTFSGLRILNTLNLQGNRIQEIESRALSNLGSLSTLLLSNNPLMSIQDEAFHHLANLSDLQLAHITQETFRLDYNFLPQMLRLESLSLMNSPALAQALMDFVANPEESRDVMRNLTLLDLSYDNLRTLSPRFLTVFPSLTSAILEGNNFQCTRDLRWLGAWMRSVGSRVTFGFYEEAVCQHPSRLMGINVRDVDDSDWATDDEITAEDAAVVEQANFDQMQADGGKESHRENSWEGELNRNPDWMKKTSAKKVVNKKMTIEEKKKREEKRKMERKARRERRQKGNGKKRKGAKGKKLKKGGDKKNRKGKGKKRNKDKRRKSKKGSGRRKKRVTVNNTIL